MKSTELVKSWCTYNSRETGVLCLVYLFGLVTGYKETISQEADKGEYGEEHGAKSCNRQLANESK